MQYPGFRRWEFCLCFVCACTLFGCFGWWLFAEDASESTVIRASRFLLVDQQGRIRASMDVSSDGDVALGFLDDKGITKAGFGVDRTGSPSLTLQGNDGRTRFIASTTENGSPYVDFLDGKKERMSFHVNDDTSLDIVLYGNDGKARTQLGVFTDDSAAIYLANPNSEYRIKMIVDKNGNSVMEAIDDAGNILWSATK